MKGKMAAVTQAIKYIIQGGKKSRKKKYGRHLSCEGFLEDGVCFRGAILM